MNLSNLIWFLPEAIVTLVILGLFTEYLLVKQTNIRRFFNLAICGLFLVYFTFPLVWGISGTAFHSMFRMDSYALFFKFIFLTSGILTLVMAKNFLPVFKERGADFCLIFVLLLLGTFFIASSNDLITLFISIEWITISLYILTGYLKTEDRSLESGMKYLIMGAFSSALLIYGISFVYGSVGSTLFPNIHQFAASGATTPLLGLGFLLILAGIGFKIAAFPFHLWAPDVYEGAPTPITAFLSAGSKSAGFSALLAVLFFCFSGSKIQWPLILSLMSAASLLYGNLGALKQTNIKRLFAFSSIGHAGYLLMGITNPSAFGVSTTLFYLFSYAISNLTAFLVITTANQALGSGEILAYQGLSKKSPILAAVLFVALLSLGGIPPLLGFFGKFLVIQSAIKAGFGWLAFIGVVCVVFSLFYYLNIIKQMYVVETEDQTPISISLAFSILLIFLAAVIVIIGFYQVPLFNWAMLSSASLF